MKKIKRLNEEISRWRFEVALSKSNFWFISFTNPTAGPWKTIKASDVNGNIGEVYRFILEEDRPDIIIYNDKLKTVIIFEAKDSLKKLLVENQLTKSCDVTIKLADILKSKGDSIFWHERSNYKVILGLLWGAIIKEEEKDIFELFDKYYEQIKNSKNIHSNIIIGVESLYKNESLTYEIFYKTYNDDDVGHANEIKKSLEID